MSEWPAWGPRLDELLPRIQGLTKRLETQNDVSLKEADWMFYTYQGYGMSDRVRKSITPAIKDWYDTVAQKIKAGFSGNFIFSIPLVSVLFEAYPDAENNLKINWSLLRYIDAINFNYEKENIFSFLQNNLKVSIKVYEKLFEETGVSNLPLDFDLRFSFPSVKPKGAVHLRFVKGKKKDEDALIWETQVQSIGYDAPSHKNQIIDWIAEAHQLTDDWFFKMIDGELLRRFE